MMKDIVIPFGGFYESTHGAAIEEMVETAMEQGDADMNLADRFDYSKAYILYARAYCSKLSQELGVKFHYKHLHHPKEYNFETDRIIASISPAQVEVMFSKLDDQTFRVKVKEELEPQSGFIPFHPNDVDQWLPREHWNMAQLGMALECVTEVELGPDWEIFLIDNTYELLQDLIT